MTFKKWQKHTETHLQKVVIFTPLSAIVPRRVDDNVYSIFVLTRYLQNTYNIEVLTDNFRCVFLYTYHHVRFVFQTRHLHG